MGRRNIHVTVEPELLQALDELSKREGTSRAEIIREACRMFVERSATPSPILGLSHDANIYGSFSESTEVGETQLAILKDILPGEEW